MEWEVEYTDQFEEWWSGLDSDAQDDVILFAFDPRRHAILLIGGDKTGNDRWYQEYVPIADRLYDDHLETLRREER